MRLSRRRFLAVLLAGWLTPPRLLAALERPQQWVVVVDYDNGPMAGGSLAMYSVTHDDTEPYTVHHHPVRALSSGEASRLAAGVLKQLRGDP